MKKNFHDFYFGMSIPARKAWVQRVGTSIGYAERLAGGFKVPSLPMAVRMVRASGGAIDLNGIVETCEARSGSFT